MLKLVVFETNTGKKIIKLIFPHKLSLNYEKDILNLEKSLTKIMLK